MNDVFTAKEKKVYPVKLKKWHDDSNPTSLLYLRPCILTDMPDPLQCSDIGKYGNQAQTNIKFIENQRRRQNKITFRTRKQTHFRFIPQALGSGFDVRYQHRTCCRGKSQ